MSTKIIKRNLAITINCLYSYSYKFRLQSSKERTQFAQLKIYDGKIVDNLSKGRHIKHLPRIGSGEQIGAGIDNSHFGIADYPAHL